MTETFYKGRPSPSLISFLNMFNFHKYEFLTKVDVDTSTKKVIIHAGDIKCELDCEIGKNGTTPHHESIIDDGKTPICKTKVRHIDMPTEDINNPCSAVLTKTIEPKINLGPCFVCLYITVPGTEKIRGIGFHGSASDKEGLLPTDGCIRLRNADLLLIRKLFFKNLNVTIK